MNEEPWSGNHNDRLHRHKNDAVDAIASYVYNACNVNDFIKDEWIKANPNAFKTKKWEEFKDMKNKKIVKNVGYSTNVMVPVDVKTNLASIDANILNALYRGHDIAEANIDWYRECCNKLDQKIQQLREDNEQVVKANEEISQENEKLKEENDRLKTKVTRLQLVANSFYGKSCYPCNYVLYCGRHYGESAANAFAKAAESLAKHLESGKPTYNQLLEENEKLKRDVNALEEANDWVSHKYRV